jgi:hypothetical protein
MSAEPLTVPPPSDGVTARWTATSVVPARCTDTDLLRGLGYSQSTFYRLKAAGKFTFLELQPAIATTTQYSGHLITKWLRGELRPPAAPRPFLSAVRRRRGRTP